MPKVRGILILGLQYFSKGSATIQLIKKTRCSMFTVQVIEYQKQCGFFCLLGRDQKIETKLGCENIMSQNTIVQRIGLIERLTF